MEYKPKRDIDEVLSDIADVLVIIEGRLLDLEERQFRHMYECPTCRKSEEAHSGGSIKN
jgi:hypothetical protein